MAKIIVVLYDDPVDGYPQTYARDDIPKIKPIPTGRRPLPRKRSTSSRVNSLEAFPASWACVSSSKTTVIRSSSRPTRTATRP